VTYGAAGFTYGDLRLPSDSIAADVNHTDGGVTKANADVMRLSGMVSGRR